MKKFLLLFLAGAVLILPGCAAINQMEAAQMEQSLTTSGFRIVPANTPARADSLAKLKPYRMHRKNKDGTFYYIFPDPKQRVLYIGTEEEYHIYQGYSTQQQISDDELMDRQMYGADSLAWGDWNIWGPVW